MIRVRLKDLTSEGSEGEGSLGSYIPIAVMIAIAAVIAAAMVGGSMFLGPKKPGEIKSTAYECGMVPVGNARERFPIKFYLIAMLFIVFDIETIFLYPWAVAYHGLNHDLKVFNLIEMAVFVAILFAGYFYILGKGALDWDESDQARKVDVLSPAVLAPAARSDSATKNQARSIPARLPSARDFRSMAQARRKPTSACRNPYTIRNSRCGADYSIHSNLRTLP